MIKSLIAASTFLIFLHHTVCTVLYSAPTNPLTNNYQKYVNGYMDPFFTQKWLLFAPDPATFDLKLWYRVKYNNAWQTWYDPLQPVLEKHQHMRFTYNAKLLYIYGDIPRELHMQNQLLTHLPCPEKDSACLQKHLDSIYASAEFKLAKKYVKRDIAETLPAIKIDSIQIMVIQLYPKQYSERLSNKPFGFAKSTEFKPVAFNND